MWGNYWNIYIISGRGLRRRLEDLDFKLGEIHLGNRGEEASMGSSQGWQIPQNYATTTKIMAPTVIQGADFLFLYHLYNNSKTHKQPALLLKSKT